MGIENLFIEGTKRTPEIDFNIYTGELILSGKSIPENSAKVYEPLIEWIAAYIKAPPLVTNLRLNLEYYNSSSLIWIVKMIRLLGNINVEDSCLLIHLFIEKEDYDEMDIEDITALIESLIKKNPETNISLGVKIHSFITKGVTIEESTVVFAKLSII